MTARLGSAEESRDSAPARTNADGSGFVYLGVPDLHGTLRGKALTRRSFEGVLAGQSATLTDLLLALDPTDEPITDLTEVGTRSGAADLTLTAEPDTLRPLSWRPGWELCLASASWPTGDPCEISPRVVLATLLAELAERGLEAMACLEYEVRLRDAASGAPLCAALSYSFGELGPFERFASGLRRALEAMGIELSAVHTEAGPGLLEINLGARRGMLAADEAMLVKLAVKDIARTLGLEASFLAKTAPEQEGSSGHLHLSLWAGKRNLFAEGMDGPLGGAVAGLLEHMAAASLLYNPNINSYKRLVPGYFAPVNASWGVDNRSTAVRVIPGSSPGAARLELRRPGSDANPYLALAGALASVLLGIDKGLRPPPASDGDASAEDGDSALPGTLEAALAAFAHDAPLRARLGERFARHLEVSRQWELRAWQRSVSDWERERYERSA